VCIRHGDTKHETPDVYKAANRDLTHSERICHHNQQDRSYESKACGPRPPNKRLKFFQENPQVVRCTCITTVRFDIKRDDSYDNDRCDRQRRTTITCRRTTTTRPRCGRLQKGWMHWAVLGQGCLFFAMGTKRETIRDAPRL
jgi:hypothetical protein